MYETTLVIKNAKIIIRARNSPPGLQKHVGPFAATLVEDALRASAGALAVVWVLQKKCCKLPQIGATIEALSILNCFY
ncbi:MAG: hypothetical protein RRY12_08510 [Cloacibacillus sp.]